LALRKCLWTSAAAFVAVLCACDEGDPAGVPPAPDDSMTCVPTTPPDPVSETNSLLILSPNGGECYRVGDTLVVEFGHVDSAVEADFIECTIDLKMPEEPTFAVDISGGSIMLSDSPLRWPITDSLWVDQTGNVPFPVGKSKFGIEIRLYSGGSDHDASDQPFSILPRP
jgi:hypothetical protein